MSDITAESQVSSQPAEQISPAPAVTEQTTSAESTTPQTETPAGTDEQQKAAAEQPPEKEPTAEDRRRERNRERWRQMRQTQDDALRRAAAAEAELNRIRTGQQPDFSQYTDPEEKLAARTAHMLRQNMAGDHESQAKAAREDAQRAMYEAWNVAKDEARSRMPDFDQVVTDRTPIHQRAAPFIVESEKGAEIAYWLGKNPDAARDLYGKFDSNPAQALVELGRIEARLSAPPPKPVSTAPKPAPTLNGGVSPMAFDPHTASIDDVAAQLRKAGIIR